MNLLELFQQKSPEVAQRFDGLIQSASSMKALGPKVEQLIYIALLASQGETKAIKAHVPLAKKAGATRDEIKEAIALTTMVCEIKGIAICLFAALDAYDNAE